MEGGANERRVGHAGAAEGGQGRARAQGDEQEAGPHSADPAVENVDGHFYDADWKRTSPMRKNMGTAMRLKLATER